MVMIKKIIMNILFLSVIEVVWTLTTGRAQTLDDVTPVSHFTTSSTEFMEKAPQNQSRIALYLGGIFSLGGIWDGSGIVPGVEMAFDHINGREDVLPGYELKMVWHDSQCYSGLGTRYFIEHIFHKPTKLLLLGPACSIDVQPVAETSHYWNLITFSYSAGSPALSNRDKYPYFYRTITPEVSFNPIIIRMIQHFGWKRIATIHQNHELFSLAIENLLVLIEANNLTLVTSETIAKDPRVSVSNVEERDGKIVFVSMYSDHARKVFCQAYKQGMMNPGYVWITYDWYGPRWWANSNDDIECSVEEMDEAIASTTYITVDRAFLSTKNDPTISGFTPQELVTQLKERMEWPVNQQYTYNVYAPFGYDAAWSIALMLNRSIEILKTKVFANGEQRRLEDFNYDDWEMARMFFDLLKKTDFVGMSGNIAFKGGDRVAGGSIRQITGDSRRTVGYYLVEEDRIEWIDKVEWKGGNIPTDHTATIRQYKGITDISYIIICIVAGMGILIAMVFLGFNLKFRTQRTVKMSSPYLNNFIIVGSILIYMSVIVGGLDNNLVSLKTLQAACQMRAWMLSTGFVLAFGSMFSKTWRVYRVAALKTPKRKVITDNHLFIMVFVFFCVDVIVLGLWQILDPIFVEVIDVNEMRNPEIANQRIITYINQCSSDDFVYWILPLYGYKGLLLIFGTFLAWETRKVTIAALNDSKLIGICVYNTVVLCIVGVSVSFLITNDTETLYIFTSCITIFCATLTLIVLFVPKMISVYRFPEGEPTTTMKGSSLSSGLKKPPGNADKTTDDINKLQIRVLELEEELDSSKKKASSVTTGCGMWCAGFLCRCCSTTDTLDADVIDVDKKEGEDNPAMTNDTNTI